MEQLIRTKAVGVADAKKRAERLQQEAKELLLKASEKLQQLKGDVMVTSLPAPKERCQNKPTKPDTTHISVSLVRSRKVLRRQPEDSRNESRAAGGAGGCGQRSADGDQPQSYRLQHLRVLEFLQSRIYSANLF